MISWPSLLAIFGMAATTLLIKIAGVALAGRLPSTGFAASFLRNIPGAVMASLVAPALAFGTLAESLAAAATALVYVISRNLFLAMAAGVLGVVLVRLALGG